MKVIVLPGFSIGNQEFLDTVRDGLKKDFPAIVVWPWRHWKTEGEEKFIVEDEVVKISEIITEPVYIVAKSIGTLASMLLLQEKAVLIQKLILNGIPLNSFDEGVKVKYREQLSKYDPEKLIVFQNQNDPWGSFADVSRFINEINPKIKVISMLRDDHSYPYVEEFAKFLI